jgi:hypothetical protein
VNGFNQPGASDIDAVHGLVLIGFSTLPRDLLINQAN